jgi:hypothetical protein
VSGQLAAAPASIFGAEPLGLITILALLFLWISGAFQQILPPAAPARPSTIRLGVPRLVGMSATDAVDAAQLLGSSAARLMATDWETE